MLDFTASFSCRIPRPSNITTLLILSLLLNTVPVSCSPFPDNDHVIRISSTYQPRSLPSWLAPLLPKKGATLADEMKCYSLPFGGIGFVSHVLIYWQIFCLWNLRSPLLPWMPLSMRRLDMALAIITLVVTPLISVFTVVRCARRWEFVLIALWTGLTSGTVGWWTLRTVAKLDKRTSDLSTLAKKAYQHVLNDTEDTYCCAEDRRQQANTMFNFIASSKPEDLGDKGYTAEKRWLMIYVLAVLIAFPGLASLVYKTWGQNRAVRDVTYSFSAVAGAWFVLEAAWVFFWGLLATCTLRKKVFQKHNIPDTWGKRVAYYYGAMIPISISLFCNIILVLTVLFAFYSDWVLGAVARNLAGAPSKDVAPLYWTFFIAKRITMLSG